ncbi:hypothetical protein VNO80_25708 [Phaseolus coccineus]|uniref:DUF4218 domain-containing protein n=1 Tax=Phaseolus coccineus TaxID=3886 RepID=A0AAN9QP89_PHACN
MKVVVAYGYRDWQDETRNFSEKLGGEGFGSVFKGMLDDSSVVAVKELESFSQREKQSNITVSLPCVPVHSAFVCVVAAAATIAVVVALFHSSPMLPSCTREYVGSTMDDVVHDDDDDRLEDMIHDVGVESFAEVHGYRSMSSDAETPLYLGSTKFTRLSAVLRLMNLKTINGWTDKSFTELLQLLKDMLPEGNILPNRNYEVKKILCPMGMEYKKIHACPNDCALYIKDFKLLKSFSRCGLARYKLKHKDDDTIEEIKKHGPPMKVMWYLPIIPRMKRLFTNPNDVKNLRWHADERKCDGMYRHPADSIQWKKFDDEFPKFGKESRNLRLGLATDGMNPFGYSVKGHKACPVCEEDTSSQQLKHGRKTIYLLHRRFLRSHHPYQRLKKTFNGHQETSGPQTPLTGVRFTKRHCIDVTHVEKNVCDSLIGTLLNINGKTKDGLNARLDLIDMNIRGELAPIQMGKRTYLPPACYTMSKDEKLLLVAIRGILPKNVRHTITHLCSFFSSICCKVIDPLKLDELKDEIVVILCELEMFFPPSFFDSMVHLVVHLVREVRLCGPVYLRWMYPVERYMKILKGYVKNHYHPEASMIERYIAEESIEFCLKYMSKANPIGLPANSWHHRRSTSKCLHGVNIVRKSRSEVLQAHFYILNNTDEVIPYIEAHKAIVKANNPRQAEKWVLMEHNRTFMPWFKDEVFKDVMESETLTLLAAGLKFDVISCKAYKPSQCSFPLRKIQILFLDQ